MKLPFVPIPLSRRGLPEVTPLTTHAVIFDASFVSWSSVRMLRGQRHRDLMLMAALGGADLINTSVGDRLLRFVYPFPPAMRRFLALSSRGER